MNDETFVQTYLCVHNHPDSIALDSHLPLLNLSHPLSLMMRHDMLLQLPTSSHSHLTESTPVRLSVCVRVDVELQIGQFVERFGTVGACIWFLARVNEHVISQIPFLMESFVANVALELFRRVVSAHVRLQG